jgi:hypothetical protein
MHIYIYVVSYGRDMWPLTLRKEHRVCVFDNRVLKKISGLDTINWRMEKTA